MSRLHTSHRVFLHATVISMVVSSLFTGSVFAADALVSDQTQVPNGNAFILNKIESATASFTHDTTSNFYGTLLNDGETNPVNENYSLDLTINGTLAGDGSVRAFQNYANNIVFNGSASIVVETNKTLRPSSTSTDLAFFQIDQEGYTANTTFKGNTHIAIKGNSNGNAVFADAVQVNKDAKGNLELPAILQQLRRQIRDIPPKASWHYIREKFGLPVRKYTSPFLAIMESTVL